MISQLEYRIEELEARLDEELKSKKELASSKETNISRINELESSNRAIENNLTVTIAARDQLDAERTRV